MPGHYPFIDIAVLDAIRHGFARGDALVVLTRDLQSALWANGPGAKLFGFDRIEDIVGNSPEFPVSTRRQIMALTQNTVRSATVRLRGQLVQLQISDIVLPDGVAAYVLASAEKDTHDDLQSQQRVISGLGDDSTHVALLDDQGAVLAATAHFSDLAIPASTLTDLVIEASDAPERIVKRRIRAGQQSIPGGIACLSDHPGRYLLCMVTQAPDQAPDIETVTEPDLQSDVVAVLEEAAPVPALPQDVEMLADLSPMDAAPPTIARFAFDADAAPARFIWKTDADTVFSEISPEFAQALGPHAADIIGRRFGDVANVFGFDLDGAIVDLLDKRDTWSGRRILWPIEGTNLRAPVELAALPTYSRDRSFMGFRGFGVIHPSEAEPDPDQIGIVLAGGFVEKKPTHVVKDEIIPAPLVGAGEKLSDKLIEKLALAALNQTVTHTDKPNTDGPIADATPTNVPHEEKPALSITPSPGRRLGDKIIRLAEHRSTQNDDDAEPVQDIAPAPAPIHLEPTRPARPEGGLSPTERNAFREIAERLRRQGLGSDRATSTPDEPQLALDITAAEPEIVAAAPASVAEQPLIEPESPDAEPMEETPLLARLPVPIIIHSADTVHYANQALLDLTGYQTIEAIIGAGGIDALFNADPDDQAEHQGMVLRHADGSEEPVNAHLQFVPWRTGRALMLSILPQSETASTEDFEPVASNDDDRSAAIEERQALQTHIDELSSILDTATDGVVLIGQDGLIRSMNHSASALFGFEPEDTEGKSFSMLFAIESQRAAMDYLNGLSSNGVLSVLNDGREVIGREAQGRFIPMFMTIGKLPASKGYCAVLRDITQWKRAEEELTTARKEAERASSQKTEFLARISHEIRTPLNAIIGFSELMADEKFGPVGNQRYRDYLRDINRSGNHVLALVNDLLDISKIEAGGLDMQFEAVSLNDAISEAVALMQPQANRERVIIRSSFPSNLPDIVADTRSIKQVALNLLSNAVRFTQAGGQVIVSTNYEANGDVIMRVRDTGIGMSSAEVEQALKPFRQVGSLQHRQMSAKSASNNDWRNEGTGLGLPLTKAMVEANRAQFSIDSAPGRGTVVEVIFPPTRVLAD